jgi:hypothetical protein
MKSTSISSNFGEKRMAKSAKLPGNSLKLFWSTSIQKCFVQWLFVIHAKKATRKLLMKLKPGVAQTVS